MTQRRPPSMPALASRRRGVSRTALLGLAVVLVLLDQGSKAWVRQHLLPGVVAPLIPGLVQLRWVRNSGAAFSLFTDATGLLAVLSLVVALVLLVWLWRAPRLGLWQGLALAFLLGGTVGNGIDRWRLGHVTDFLELVPISFPIFNGADLAINLAVACFAIDALSRRRDPNGT